MADKIIQIRLVVVGYFCGLLMNLPLYIARRMSRNEEGSFSATIHRVAVVSIALSLSALILSFFVLYGFKEAIRDKVFNLSGHLTVNKYAITQSQEDNGILADDALLSQLYSYSEIRHAQRFVMKWGLIKSDEGVQGIFMKGVGTDFNLEEFSRQMVSGEFPKPGADSNMNAVVISDMMARQMRISVGDELTLFFVQQPPRYRRIQVVGLYSTGMEEFDEKVIIGHIDMLQRVNGWDTHQVSGVEVLLNDYRLTEAMEEKLFNDLDVDLNVISAQRQFPQIFEWLELLNRNVLILLVVIVVVASLGMVSMVLILIMERTRMIGMLKALGSPEPMIRKIFVFTGIQLIVKGLLIGNGLALLLSWLQYQFEIIPLDVSNYYIHTVPIAFHWPTLIALNLLLAVLVGLTLFIPVRIVSGVQPVQAIRFD